MLRLGLLSAFPVAVAAAQFGCGRTEPAASAPQAAATKRTSALVARPVSAPTAEPRAVQAAAPWPPAEMQDPDPRMRRFALEQCAREPTESLDMAAAALVDPDESIRERAEQVFEAALARQR